MWSRGQKRTVSLVHTLGRHRCFCQPGSHLPASPLRIGAMVLRIKVLAAKLGSLSLIPITHMVEGETSNCTHTLSLHTPSFPPPPSPSGQSIKGQQSSHLACLGQLTACLLGGRETDTRPRLQAKYAGLSLPLAHSSKACALIWKAMFIPYVWDLCT